MANYVDNTYINSGSAGVSFDVVNLSNGTKFDNEYINSGSAGLAFDVINLSSASPTNSNYVSIGTTTAAGTTLTPVYRGVLGGEYVFSEGTAPVGATDVTIIAYSAS